MYVIPAAKQTLLDSNAYQKALLQFTWSESGVSKTLNVWNKDIIQGSLSVDRYTTTGNTLALGTAVAAELNFKLDNHDGRFDDMTFAGKTVELRIYVDDPSNPNTQAYLPDSYSDPVKMGFFVVCDETRSHGVISITAYDKMICADKAALRSINFQPGTTTLYGIMKNCSGNAYTGMLWNAEFLGNSDNHLNWPNFNRTYMELPTVQNGVLTYRQFMQWGAAMFGKCLYSDYDGKQALGWYQCSSDADNIYDITESRRYSFEASETPISITGLFYKSESMGEVVYGQPDYVIDMSSNSLVQLSYPNPANVYAGLSDIYVAIQYDKSYYPFSATIKPAPHLWPMDCVSWYTSDGSIVYSTITHTHYVLNGVTTIEAVGEAEAAHSVAPSSSTAGYLNSDMRDLIYPVGTLYFSTANTNPGVFLGGTWEAFAPGRVLVGVGTGTDANSTSQTFSGGDSGGEYTHELSTAEMPAHRHQVRRNNSSGSSSGGCFSYGGSTNYSWGSAALVSYAGGNNTTADTPGLTTKHNTMQPYIAVYIWRRTA